jgi:hypothetical protein
MLALTQHCVQEERPPECLCATIFDVQFPNAVTASLNETDLFACVGSYSAMLLGEEASRMTFFWCFTCAVPNRGNGADLEKYSWTQTLSELYISVPVPQGTKARMVNAEIKKTSITIGLKGQPPIIKVGKERALFSGCLPSSFTNLDLANPKIWSFAFVSQEDKRSRRAHLTKKL